MIIDGKTVHVQSADILKNFDLDELLSDLNINLTDKTNKIVEIEIDADDYDIKIDSKLEQMGENLEIHTEALEEMVDVFLDELDIDDRKDVIIKTTDDSLWINGKKVNKEILQNIKHLYSDLFKKFLLHSKDSLIVKGLPDFGRQMKKIKIKLADMKDSLKSKQSKLKLQFKGMKDSLNLKDELKSIHTIKMILSDEEFIKDIAESDDLGRYIIRIEDGYVFINDKKLPEKNAQKIRILFEKEETDE